MNYSLHYNQSRNPLSLYIPVYARSHYVGFVQVDSHIMIMISIKIIPEGIIMTWN